jgi:DNA polymerase-3 subunit gamma/tau
LEAKKTPIQKTVSIPLSISAAKKILTEQSVSTPSHFNQAQSVTEKVEEKPVDFFDKEKLSKVLAGIVDSFKEEHRNLEAVALNQPFELEGEKAVFHLVSDIQAGIFQKIKQEITTELRRKLNNYNLQIEFEVLEEVKDDKKRLYTSTDKLHYLREKSDLLDELLNRFKLETDF